MDLKSQPKDAKSSASTTQQPFFSDVQSYRSIYTFNGSQEQKEISTPVWFKEKAEGCSTLPHFPSRVSTLSHIQF